MKRGLFLFFIFCAISNAYAQMECESIPSCAEMGYTQDSCAGGKGIRCPFDETKFYCAGTKQLPDALEPVITPEDWTAACADKIDHCAAYNTDCKCTACEDDYNLADNTCVSKCNKSADTCAAESKIFNADTCTCKACPSGYLFDSEVNECREACKKDIEHCLTYDSQWADCKCQTCETNYLLDGEVCKKMCTIVANCQTYDSDYDPCNCTACKYDYLLDGGECKKSCVRFMHCSTYDSKYDPCQCSKCEKVFTKVNNFCVHNCKEKCGLVYSFFAGEENTKAAIEQLGNKALAAYATSQFYVGDKNGDFGQGKWYLPSMGEWLMLSTGTDGGHFDKNFNSNGINSQNETVNINIVNQALTILANKNVKARHLYQSSSYWSSSEQSEKYVYYLGSNNAPRNRNWKTIRNLYNNVRCMLRLKDCFNPSSGGTAPQIGDVMYEDKTYGPAADYDGSKMPVGVIALVSEDERDVTLINLNDLGFSSSTKAGNFNPDNPYSGIGSIYWSTDDKKTEDIIGIQNIDNFEEIAKASGNCPCQFYSKPESENICTIVYSLFAGQENTKAAVEQIGNKALAAYATTQFYVGDKNGNFGQGKWYLPSIGEWMYFYGTDASKITSASYSIGKQGAIGDTKVLIDNTLTTLEGKGAEAKALTNDYYWTSSEFDNHGGGDKSPNAITFDWKAGYRSSGFEKNAYSRRFIRCSSLVKDCFNPSSGETAPQIGDVMYEDKTYGSADDYDGSKMPVGVIAAVSEDGRDAAIINLKDLTFTSYLNQVENFDPDNPYGRANKNVSWSTSDTKDEDIIGIVTFDYGMLRAFAKASENRPCQFYPPE